MAACMSHKVSHWFIDQVVEKESIGHNLFDIEMNKLERHGQNSFIPFSNPSKPCALSL